MCKSTIFKCIMSAFLGVLLPLVAIASVVYSAANNGSQENIANNQRTYTNIGTPVTDSQLANWDISVFYDGENLPPGSGTLAEGEEIYAAQCAVCHGDFGEGASGYPKMLGAPMHEFIQAALDGEDNVSIRGVNNLWAHAPTLFDFIRRAMPFFSPQSLTDDQTYAVTGYVLLLAEVIDGEVEDIDGEYLTSIKMPSADNFYTDTRPDTQNARCMSNCYDHAPEIKGSALGDADVSVGAIEKRDGG